MSNQESFSEKRLRFGRGNRKVGSEVWTFSLPAGWACPGARECLARVERESGHLSDGAGKGELHGFRCFAASMESRQPSVRKSRWANFEALRGASFAVMVERLEKALPPRASIIRVHVSGDFFSEDYFKAWMEVGRRHPEILFYAYTKSIRTWIRCRDLVPANFKLTASYGGVWDSLIKEAGLKSATVVFSEAQALALGLAIDHDDSLARGEESFALLLHGTQAKGTPAAKALSVLKRQSQ